MKKFILLLLALSILVLSAACGSEAAAAPVKAVKQVQDQNVEAFGVVKATIIKDLNLDFNAPITEVFVKEGQHVKLGQPLVGLDLSEMKNQVNDKKISLAAAQNSTKHVLASTDMEKLQNDLKNAQSIYNKDLKELTTKEELYNAGSIPLEDLNNFKKQLDADGKNLEDISYSIESLKNDKDSENFQKDSDISLLKSDIGLLNSKLSRPCLKGSHIISDVENGLVYDIGCVQGDLAGSQKKLLSIMDLNSLVVEANIPEEFINSVKIGSTAEITPVADKSRKYTGKVSYISGLAVNNNGETQIPARILLDKRDDFLLPGFNVDVSIAMKK